MSGPRNLGFRDEDYPWRPDVDYRAHPERYRVGRGEQGVLRCEPYKGELLAHWRFATPEAAEASSAAILAMFYGYLARGEFVGADMARKFLQMGFTRARRYANRRGGRKYAGPEHRELPRGTGDPVKAESARIFHARWREAEADPRYAAEKKAWRVRYG